MTTMDIPELREEDKTRFWKKIHRRGKKDCWKWKAGTDECGYGKFRLFRRSYIAHRVVYTLLRGPIPEGLCVCHTCDNPPCCNPAHLWVGTFEENMEDKVKKNRCGALRGESHHWTRLTKKKVYAIRKLLKQGLLIRDVADIFDVGQSTIGCIKYGLSWKHLK